MPGVQTLITAEWDSVPGLCHQVPLTASSSSPLLASHRPLVQGRGSESFPLTGLKLTNPILHHDFVVTLLSLGTCPELIICDLSGRALCVYFFVFIFFHGVYREVGHS